MTALTLPTRPLLTLGELADWLRTDGGPLTHFGAELATVLDTAEPDATTVEEVQRQIGETEIDLSQDASVDDGLREIMNRYHHVRAGMNEHHDIDISKADYAEKVDAMLEKAANDDDFRYRVRARLVEFGAMTPAENDAYALACLAMLLT